MAHVLLIDDDPDLIAEQVRHAFPPPAHRVEVARTGADGLARVVAGPPDVVLLDLRLPDRTGLEVFDAIRATDARIPVVFVTLSKTADAAIEAMKRGAFDYLFKPLDPAQVRRVVGEALAVARRMREPAVLAETLPEEDTGGVIVGACPAMREVYKEVGRVAAQDVPVLITGESGTGKELIARAIYQHGRRNKAPFLALNCAAIPEPLLESELFGHEKGAFTGADRKRIGKFEQCHGGTIFLDEVGEMSPLTQAKILRLIQDQQFERVGGNETVRTDVRLIAATNADLEKMAEDGRFRLDLYFRLNVFTIRLPALRDRGDDIGLLVEHFARRFGRELGKPGVEVSADAAAALRAYPWPGNVRELQSVLKQSILQTSGSVLLPDFLPAHVRKPATPPAPAGDAPGAFDWDGFVAGRIAAGSENLYAEGLERMEREVLVRVLKHTAGNQLQAARILGITRGSLRNKIRTLGISIARSVWSDDDQGDS